jgi:hypothetical protein
LTVQCAALKGATFARQPCCHIPVYRNLGQWLCVPSFRMVCLYQATLDEKNNFSFV